MEIETLLGYGDDVMLYIDSARDFVLPRTIVYTESMRHVGQQITDGHTDICLTGPKGCLLEFFPGLEN